MMVDGSRPRVELDGADEPELLLERALVGRSLAITEVRRRIRQAAACDATVLLTGESGVGKELASSWIHALGPRARAPFVSIHCAGVTETLLESELFGHRRGALPTLTAITAASSRLPTPEQCSSTKSAR